jgi:hypothetical protein
MAIYQRQDASNSVVFGLPALNLIRDCMTHVPADGPWNDEDEDEDDEGRGQGQRRVEVIKARIGARTSIGIGF